jgi:hypothetical protein
MGLNQFLEALKAPIRSDLPPRVAKVHGNQRNSVQHTLIMGAEIDQDNAARKAPT